MWGLKEIFTKHKEACPVESTQQMKVRLQIDEAAKYSELDRLQDRIIYLKANPEEAGLAPYTIGEDWHVMLTLDEASDFCKNWLISNELSIRQQSCGHLLSFNRREPWSPYALKTATPKTNWHRYGRCPYIKGAKYTYSKAVLNKWLEENVRPTAKTVEKTPS